MNPQVGRGERAMNVIRAPGDQGGFHAGTRAPSERGEREERSSFPARITFIEERPSNTLNNPQKN